ncbi:MAG: hypothetical protein JSS66_02575 [Armatimonadetes bacterium]|nr:hypothetical protein [Armatimonadota bacterium]
MRLTRTAFSVLGIGASGLVPTMGLAQVALPSNPEKPVQIQNEIGGRVAFEQLLASADRPSLPLRYGHLKQGSEKVETEGRTLVRDKDYYCDYVAGVIYLKIPVRDGQSVSAEYRYDEATGAQGTFGINSSGTKFQGYKLDLNPSTSIVLGMGLTERMGDGTVLSSNIYGLQNSFNFGMGSVKGMFMVGDREKVATNNLFGEKAAQSNVETGRSQAIVQNLQSNLFGGKVKLGYRDIGDKFGGFSAFQAAGYDQAQIQQFSNEKGLKRTDFSAENIGGKGLALGAGVHSVGDDSGAVSWRNYAANLGGFQFNWNDRKIDPGFTRFKDIAEGDRNQLAKERGLEFQTLNIGRKWGKSALNYDASKVESLEGFGIYRRAFSFASPLMSAAFSEQHVQTGFNRFNDLRDGDRGQLAREGGLVRQNISFGLTPKGGPAVSWKDAVIRMDTGDFVARDFGLSYGPFSISNSRREVAPGFSALGNLAQPEIGEHLTSIVKMTDPTANVQGQDWQGWGNSAGLGRSAWKLGYSAGKGTSLSALAENIEGAKDDLSVRGVTLTSPKFTASFKEQDTGAGFNETTRLLFSEQQRLGTAVGLQRADFNFSSMLSGLKRLNYSQMRAEDAAGSALRQMLSLTDKGFNISYARRSVDPAFASLPGMVDPERDLLMGMVGFDQSEIVGGWQLLPSMSLEYRDSKAVNASNGLGRYGSVFALNWKPDKNTQFTSRRTEIKQTDPTQPLVDQQIDQMGLSRDFGRLGKLTLSHDQSTFDGSQDTNPDSQTNSVVYENQITKSTSIRTEHSKTLYENGEHETKTSNSLSQALTSRVGVSVTDTKVEREGDKPDETHRDYGFWVDFGKNIRLNYKAMRQMRGETTGESHNEVSVTPGQAQGVNVGGASYQHNGWDDQRDQSIGNVSFSNVKPMHWGFLQDVRFNYAVDSVHDMDAWQKEYRTMGFGARIGAFAFSLDYKSQGLPAGDRAIDRVFAFTTDVSGKSKLRADVKYNLRTLPFGQQAMIRNYTITAEPFKNWSLTHSLITNPLQADNNALLGAVATPTRSNKWGINYEGDPRTKFAMGYEEFYNEANNQQVSALKFGATLFANNPSPLVIEYIVAETNASGEMQRSHGISLNFTQRPGPNQSLAFKISNLNWELARPSDQSIQNWNLRLDYSWKF